MLEIELKVRVPALGPLRDALTAKGAEPRGREHEHDVYYNAPHRNFSETDEALRIRYAGGKAVVTYKGAKIRNLGLKAREELNTAVESGEVTEQILQRLGFVKTAIVDKWRETYTISNATISLDEVNGLGTFAEIEVIAGDGDRERALAAIETIKKELGIDGYPILESYLELLLSKA
ncbi:MAG: CYTH domain protein [Methanoregula sp. PtaU1.Bin051]|nr:MAG: CYTH domain protein [Methanoregula sp. PtaU1.Bin051]